MSLLVSFEFIQAKNKLEAVARISNLTKSGPESLGPGSKEHKSVLINLANGLDLTISESDTKQDLARKIVTHLGGAWDKSCESVGQTITLVGLNRILKLAENRLATENDKSNNILNELSLKSEVEEIAKIALGVVPITMDGKKCIEQMRDEEDKRWRQVQWQGFYFEMIMQSALTRYLGGGRKKLINTEFDYVYKNIWDMKTHSNLNSKGKISSGLVILNDTRAMDLAIQNGGMGLIMLSGIPTYDLDSTKWHKKYRGNSSGEPRRVLKSKFIAQSLEIYFIPTTSRLEEALKKMEIEIKPQGKNSNGKPRPSKYSLNLNNAYDSDLKLFSYKFTKPTSN
jgi:hypothetical protein